MLKLELALPYHHAAFCDYMLKESQNCLDGYLYFIMNIDTQTVLPRASLI